VLGLALACGSCGDCEGGGGGLFWGGGFRGGK
jgi:hypothetical protein